MRTRALALLPALLAFAIERAAAIPPPPPPPDPDVLAADATLAAIAADVTTACERTSRRAVYPVDLSLTAAPDEEPALEIHVDRHAGPEVADCVRAQARASLAAHAPAVTGLVSLDRSFLVGRRPAPLPGAAEVRTAWRGTLAGDPLAAARLDELLPPEVSTLRAGALFRPAPLVPPRAAALATWLTRDLPRVGAFELERAAYLDGDLLLVPGRVELPTATGGWSSAEDGVSASLLPPDAAALARRGRLPGFVLDPSSAYELGDVVLRTDATGAVVDSASCEPLAPRVELTGLRGFTPHKIVIVRRLASYEGRPRWTATTSPPTPGLDLQRICRDLDEPRPEGPALDDEHDADLAIVRFEATAARARRPHEAALVLYRLTIENRSRVRRAVLRVGCDSHFRDTPIPLGPGERRTFAMPRGGPYMFQGLGSLDCSPGRVMYPMRLAMVRPFDLAWDQPGRVSFTPCQGEVRYTNTPAGPDACLALVPAVETRGADGGPRVPSRGEQYYATYLERDLEVRCRDGERVLSLAVPVRADRWPSWVDPIRVPLGAGPARTITCTVDPRGALVELDRGNNVATVQVPATAP